MTEKELGRLYSAAELTRAFQLVRGDPPNRCIAHTREMIAVLRASGAKAEPLAVRAYIQGSTGLDTNLGFAAEHFGQPSAAIPTVSAEGHRLWIGHLVALLTECGWMIDVSIDQVHDPERGIVVNAPQIFLGTWDAELHTAIATFAATVVPLDGGGWIYYVAAHEDTGFTSGGEWNVSPEVRDSDDGLAALVRAEIGDG